MRVARRSAPRTTRVALVIATALAAIVALTGTAGAATQAPNTSKPTAGSGINTPAAMNGPDCDKTAGPYGRLNFITEGSGPVCVVQWKDGKDNGGATYQGVTKDKIKVVSLVPNEQQMSAVIGAQKPQNYATGQPGTVQAVIDDGLAGYEHAFAPKYTYGRDVEMEYVVSTGSDEAAQRADAIAVKE